MYTYKIADDNLLNVSRTILRSSRLHGEITYHLNDGSTYTQRARKWQKNYHEEVNNGFLINKWKHTYTTNTVHRIVSYRIPT